MATTPAPQTFLPSTLPVKKIYASGTNLFRIAANELGDATQWNRIAELNGLSDPWITTLTEILIPPPGTSNGGILSP